MTIILKDFIGGGGGGGGGRRRRGEPLALALLPYIMSGQTVFFVLLFRYIARLFGRTMASLSFPALSLKFMNQISYNSS